MVANYGGINMVFSLFGDNNSKSPKRSLGIRDKKILYRNAKGKCENPACKHKIDFDEMQVGHKIAYSKGGATTLKNSVCLCYRCNNLQGTDSWIVFLKKQNIPVKDPNAEKKEVKKILATKTLIELKALAKAHGYKVSGEVVEGFYDSHTKAPTKVQYINVLSKKLKLADLRKPTTKR
jgi:HNH endonuclease